MDETIGKDGKKEFQMSPEELKKTLSEGTFTPAQPQLRELIIKTDGGLIQVEKNELSILELKEVCREILAKFGG